MQDQHAAIRAKLTARREELSKRLEKIERDVRHDAVPLEQDSQERVLQTANDDVLDALDSSGRKELQLIDHALERMERGDYGECTRCGEPIGDARLKALPFAQQCIRCAEQGE
jgi:DnaK suppressor protein